MHYVLVLTDNDERTPLAIDITLIENISRRVLPNAFSWSIGPYRPSQQQRRMQIIEQDFSMRLMQHGPAPPVYPEITKRFGSLRRSGSIDLK